MKTEDLNERERYMKNRSPLKSVRMWGTSSPKRFVRLSWIIVSVYYSVLQLYTYMYVQDSPKEVSEVICDLSPPVSQSNYTEEIRLRRSTYSVLYIVMYL